MTAKRAGGRNNTSGATLTGKQRAFVLAYFANGFVGWRAAQKAGYKGDENTLMVAASRLLRNDKVIRACEEKWRLLAMPSDEIIGRLTKMAQADMDTVMSEDGTVDIRIARERGVTFLIKKQKITEKFIPQEGHDDIVIRTTELEFHDAQAALGTLAKYRGLLTERLTHDGNIEISITQVPARIAQPAPSLVGGNGNGHGNGKEDA